MAERLGGLQVDDQFVFSRCLYRDIARLKTAQNAIDVSDGATPSVYRVGSVREQAAVSDKVKFRIDRRCLVSRRRQYDRRPMHGHEYIRHDDKAASRLAAKSVDGRFDLSIAVNWRHDWHDLA